MNEKSNTLIALHSSATPEHGSPSDIIASARKVLGWFDLDPSSSDTFNRTVKAIKYFTKTNNGLAHPWSGRVFINPPSGDNGKLVKLFWDKLMYYYANREIQSAIWVGFSIDQLQTLQHTKFGGPLQFPICVPRKRLQFVKSMETSLQQDFFEEIVDPTPAIGESPTKPNFVTFLPPVDEDWSADRPCVEQFELEFKKFGEIKL